jgi:hypothetical protein
MTNDKPTANHEIASGTALTVHRRAAPEEMVVALVSTSTGTHLTMDNDDDDINEDADDDVDDDDTKYGDEAADLVGATAPGVDRPIGGMAPTGGMRPTRGRPM